MAEANKNTDASLPDYEKAEMDLLRQALKRSYKERFLIATRLYKVGQTMKKAKITYKPYINKSK